MAMSTDEVTDFKEALGLLSADELRAQLGDNEEEDALINEVLAGGKAVETKAGKEAAAAGTGEGVEGAPKAKTGDEEDEEEDDDTPTPEEIAASAKAEADAKAATAAVTTEAANAAAAAEAEKAAEAAGKEQEAEIPKPDLSIIDNKFNGELSKLDDAKAAKFQELMDGTIDAAAYSKFESQYMRDRDNLREQRTLDSEWFTEVHNFQADVLRATGINYAKDAEKGAALDDWVKRLASKPENVDREGKWYLEQAHKRVMAEFDITPTAQKPGEAAKPAAPAAAPAATKPATKPGRAPDLSTIPPTIGGLPPAADADNGDSGEFAHLDKLSGMAYERALASLTADQKARYETM